MTDVISEAIALLWIKSLLMENVLLACMPLIFVQVIHSERVFQEQDLAVREQLSNRYHRPERHAWSLRSTVAPDS